MSQVVVTLTMATGGHNVVQTVNCGSLLTPLMTTSYQLLNQVTVTYFVHLIGKSQHCQYIQTEKRFPYNLKVFCNKNLFKMSNNYSYHYLCPIQSIDIDPFSRSQKSFQLSRNFKISINDALLFGAVILIFILQQGTYRLGLKKIKDSSKTFQGLSYCLHAHILGNLRSKQG